jgi:hypothetical protein
MHQFDTGDRNRRGREALEALIALKQGALVKGLEPTRR